MKPTDKSRADGGHLFNCGNDCPESTATFTVTVGRYRVDLFHRGVNLPHGFEITTAKTTNVSGYHCTGELTFDGNMLVDFDGCAELPNAVKVALKAFNPNVSFDEFI